MANTNRKILRRKMVENKTGLARSTLYFLIQKNRFPEPIHLGPRAVGWIEEEIDDWIAKRVADRDERRIEV